MLIRLVAPLPFKDVLHLSFYPIGAGVFTGAAFALVAAAVVALLVATGYIHEIRYDFTQWGGDAGPPLAVYKRALYDCLKKESLAYTVLASGFQIAYTDLKPPIDDLSYLRPVITVLYLVIAACFFMAAVDHRKSIVFGIVLLAALVATGANILSLRAYFSWKLENSDCGKKLGQIAMDRLGASALKEMARGVQASVKDNEVYDVSVGAEGAHNQLRLSVQAAVAQSWSIFSMAGWIPCSDDEDFVLRIVKATETHTFYNSKGEWMTSFTISPADCPKQWPRPDVGP